MLQSISIRQDFAIYFFTIFTCWFYVVTLNSTQDQKTQNISLCNWTFNSTAAHDFAKFSALKALNTTKNFDFICLLECYLDSTILSDNKSLCLDGYKLIRPKTSGRVEFVFIIGKHYRLVKIIQLNYLPEFLVCEINYDNSNFHRYFVSISQSIKQGFWWVSSWFWRRYW